MARVTVIILTRAAKNKPVFAIFNQRSLELRWFFV
jgi:hypothetical protein